MKPTAREAIAPGAFHFPRYLDLSRQQTLVDECRALLDGPTPAYVPTVRGGGKMHVRMLCLGRHWNGMTYRYEPARSDFDNLPAPPLPESFRRLAAEIAHEAGMSIDADLCILNYYDADGRMGLHQDKDEQDFSAPVVSLSLGDTGLFRVGGVRRSDPTRSVRLASGDAVVLGGEGRLAFHGVDRIVPNTSTLLAEGGRINLTLRRVTPA
jgi:alkylated DNA repair protein (DNA oxidative demethylase)